ncbi:MAG: hypothetical protein EXR40_05995 [Nitrosomonadaceae bacterium]|nr:hypothetical protein [Nitrosomonadaceae bacterium]
MIATLTKTIYLSNKDILREIHHSKMTYCWVKSPEYYYYDIILEDPIKLHNRKTISFPKGAITTARETRASRLTLQALDIADRKWRESGQKGIKPKLDQFTVDSKKIPIEELVIRIQSYDHIPLEPGRKNNPKVKADLHSKVNFPPFKHVIKIGDKCVEVARSHWKGDLKKGQFSIGHGKVVNNLARMYIKLCERYSMRSNWRGYTYVEEMRGQALLQLSQVGLQFNESKSQNPFAYYTAAITNSFTRILNFEKRNQNIRDDLLQDSGQMPSWSRQLEHVAQQVEAKERNAALSDDAKENGKEEDI